MGRGISVTTRNRRGDTLLIRSDHNRIAELIQNGDGIVWEGDPRMFVRFNYVTMRYEVWRLGEDGKERIISSWKPEEFDHRVVKALVDGDTRKKDVLAEIEKHEAQLMASRERDMQDIEQELNKYIKWARKRLFIDH